jgi:membrane associated rhomboid family serine protease
MSQPAQDRANYCYRHPDRQSYVLCQRCGRTICPECQTPGAVGVTCPECMKLQRSQAPRVKSALLTRMTGSDAPLATYAIIAVCVVVYIAEFIPGVKSDILYAGVYSYPVAFEPWRLITSVFAHESILHIALNMYTLFIFGILLEPLVGRVKFLVLFLISGLAGSVGVLLLADPRQAVLGASGAIFGILGAFFVIQRHLRSGASVQLLVLIGINLVIGFIPGFGIAWQAHLGGLLIGALVGLIFVATRARSRRPLQIGLLILLSIALIVAGIWPTLTGATLI